MNSSHAFFVPTAQWIVKKYKIVFKKKTLFQIFSKILLSMFEEVCIKFFHFYIQGKTGIFIKEFYKTC